MGNSAGHICNYKKNLTLQAGYFSGIVGRGTLSLLFFLFFDFHLSAQIDNYTITHFTNENGLPQNSIKGIEIDKNGYLWLGTEVGIVRYDGNQFLQFNQLNTPELKKDRIVRLGLLKDSTVFFEDESSNYYRINAAGKLASYVPDPATQSILDSFSVFKGYSLYDSCKLRITREHAPGWILPDQSSVVFALSNRLKYAHGQYFYFNEHPDLISTDPHFKHFSKWKISGPLALKLNTDKKDRPGLTLLTGEAELYVRFGDWIYYLETDQEKKSIKSKRVLKVSNISHITGFRKWPNLNLILVGSATDGLYVFKKQFFSNVQFNNEELNIFHAQATFEKDGVLTKAGILFPDRSVTLKLSEITTESILRTKEGHYYFNRWISSKESGIVEFDSSIKELRFIRGNDLHVSCFLQMKNGGIWFSDYDHFLGKIENNRVLLINRPSNVPVDFQVGCFIQTGENELWIAGTGGVFEMDTTGSYVRLFPELSNVNIRSIYKDKNGIIWLGSYGKGIYAVYDNRIVHLPMDRNNYMSAAHCFLEDQNGYLWVTTNMGMFQFSVNELYQYIKNPGSIPFYYFYDKSDGFSTNEFNGGCVPSGIVLNNGRFSFPSMKSLIQFFPDSVKPLPPASHIHVDAILTDTANIDPLLSSFVVENNINRIQFFVSSPFFGNSYNQSIEYKITGLDSNWYPLNEDRIISLNKINSGNYQLILRKKVGFGKKNYVFEKRSFNVKPNYYETWIFKGLLILLVLVLSVLFYNLRVNYLLKQKKLLENEVQVRTKEQHLLIGNLENTISELEDSKEQLHQNTLFKEKLAMVIMHDLQSPLRFLFDATRRVHEKSEQKRHEEVNELSLELYKATGKIFNFVDDFGWWLSTMGKHFFMLSQKVDLPVLLTEITQFFTEQLKANDNRLTLSLKDVEFINSDRQLLKIIIRNIIDNANKHTTKGRIEIRTTVSDGSAVVTISDNGFGIDSERLARLRQRLREKSIDFSEKETGLGYRFIIDLSKLLNINIEIRSEKGAGTTVTLSNLKMV